MISRAARLVLILWTGAAAAGCGSPSGPTQSTGGANSGGSGPSCRTYPSASTLSFQSTDGVSRTSSSTCSWDANQRQLTCTITVGTGGPVCTTTVSTYNSLADFVDEIRVIPPVFLRTSDVQTANSAPPCGAGAIQNITYVYDAQRRVTQILNGTATVTFTAWDSAGRPTTGTAANSAPVTIAYDASARTQTQTTGAGAAAVVVTSTFDADGTPVKVVSQEAGITSTTTTQVNSTARVCK
jgi:YD repeat-containing protein